MALEFLYLTQIPVSGKSLLITVEYRVIKKKRNPDINNIQPIVGLSIYIYCVSFTHTRQMGKIRNTKRFARVKRLLHSKDSRKNNQQVSKQPKEDKLKHLPQIPSSMFFEHNKALGPPYHILLDTNFINKTLQNKLDLLKASVECLYGLCHLYITDCVMAELEKLGSKFRLALTLARDERIERLPCMHSGTYADDCIVHRVTQHRHYIVATNDKDLKHRLRKIPGVPIMYVGNHKYSIERLPDTPSAYA